MKQIYGFLFIILISIGAAQASSLADKIEGEIASMSQSLSMMDATHMTGGDSTYFLQLIRVQQSFTFGFAIPGFANLTATPFVEFWISRKFPEGFVPYRP